MPTAHSPTPVPAPALTIITPGYKTTEFWLVILVIICITILLITGTLTIADVERLWPLFLASGAYSLSRGIAKVKVKGE